jgi:regulator of replication initiation timing
MKSHFCIKEQTIIEFAGECNWCGEKEISKLDSDFEEWKPLLKHIMENKLLKTENEQLRSQIKHLEAQVYGGTTK